MIDTPNSDTSSIEDNTATTEWSTIHLNLVLDVAYPPHIDRASDPYLAVFEATRRLLMAKDPHCWRCGIGSGLEAHHIIQWAYFNVIDMEKLRKDFPNFTGTTEDEKQRFLNGPDNIVLLCKNCHTGNEGRHRIPDPLWRVRRYILDSVVEKPVVANDRPIKRIIRKLSPTVPRPDTISRPMGRMKISSSLRRLLK